MILFFSALAFCIFGMVITNDCVIIGCLLIMVIDCSADRIIEEIKGDSK